MELSRDARHRPAVAVASRSGCTAHQRRRAVARSTGERDAPHAQDLLRQLDRVHFVLSYKRLEVGTFTFAARLRSDAKSVELDVHELSMLLEGIDIQRARMAPRWEPPLDTRSTHV